MESLKRCQLSVLPLNFFCNEGIAWFELIATGVAGADILIDLESRERERRERETIR